MSQAHTDTLFYLSKPCFPVRPCFFFFNDTATTEIYTLSLHDALPILKHVLPAPSSPVSATTAPGRRARPRRSRSEEHTSELQSPCNLVCRLLLEKKKTQRSGAAANIFSYAAPGCRAPAPHAARRRSDH